MLDMGRWGGWPRVGGGREIAVVGIEAGTRRTCGTDAVWS